MAKVLQHSGSVPLPAAVCLWGFTFKTEFKRIWPGEGKMLAFASHIELYSPCQAKKSIMGKQQHNWPLAQTKLSPAVEILKKIPVLPTSIAENMFSSSRSIIQQLLTLPI
jgi:hypothetical protein